ncbi:beta-eliminating lyase-related protein [Crossiella sp. SN42]|uniref:threonine aldolase family protein n=1 Tax=Crossiella sp. SN42 TaxID=2944808 RepID=UPI00207D5614|nr:beta-eliminating lyase-related protein [Crossiella sp. SN42]MCO1582044.1 beta-eliminating lyase-related protein [Crossiella sp. SN42]
MPADAPPLRSLSLHAPHRGLPELVLGRMAAQLAPGEGPYDAVPRLERRVAELLGKPAALLFPTGTMAQQVALRLHADARGRRGVAFHPYCHLDEAERQGYTVVHGLHAVRVGERERLLTLAELREVEEPPAALLLELPQRSIGGQLPEWDELVAQTEWARERGAATHLDGARLYLAQPYYQRPLAEIAGLFDSVYVSATKGLGGVADAVLAGSEELIRHARVWRHRLGGAAEVAWPSALAAEWTMDTQLPRVPEYVATARELASGLRGAEGIEVLCDPPQTPLFHLHLAASPESVLVAARRLSEERGVYLPRYAGTMPSPRMSTIEITVGAQFDDVPVAEAVALLTELVARARELDRGCGQR